MKIHSAGEKAHKCDMCDLTFHYMSRLIEHRKVHTGRIIFFMNYIKTDWAETFMQDFSWSGDCFRLKTSGSGQPKIIFISL